MSGVSIDNAVEVNITRQSSFVKEASFNIPLILGFNSLPAFNNTPVISFTSPSDLLDSSIGFTSTSKEYLLAQQIFAQQPSISQFMIGKRKVSTINTAEPVKSVYKINDDLDEINKTNSGWYALFLADFSEINDLLLAAKWIEASKNKIASFRSNDKTILDSTKLTDISNSLSAVGFNRSMLTYHQTANEFPEAAILGKYLSKKPGTYCLAHKGLESLTAQNITDREFKAIQDANCNVYTDILGVSSYQDGRVLHKSTNFIDNTITEDALKAAIQAKIFGAFKEVDKVSNDATGMEIISTQIKSVLSQFEKDKGILSGWSVYFPKLDEMSKLDRQKRELKNIKFNAVLNGAIQKVKIDGFISY